VTLSSSWTEGFFIGQEATMALAKRYRSQTAEPAWQETWQEEGVNDFEPNSARAVYSIDTPPPTVSGNLHLGHVYSYSQTDFMARFWRMRGRNVYYPMGFDDNGLPTERLVERQLGIRAQEIGRQAFVRRCAEVSIAAEADYRALWQRLGLSIDWRYTYRTIGERARRISQWSFLDLYRRGLVYRQEAPTIWCPECQTAIAQAELNDLERQSEFITLRFQREDGGALPIATTRPELLPACVAVYVHPGDPRFRDLVGHHVVVPLFGQSVPVLEDLAADPEKGTGAVMCCTFGDVTDVAWWRQDDLPLVVAIGRDGRLTEAAGDYAGLPITTARQRIVQALEAKGLVLDRTPVVQSVRAHERCDTPVEYVVAMQWFIRVLDFKDALLEAGESVTWHPESMKARYRAWVENLHWDWCISRQRYFGIPFPAWICQGCGEILLADAEALPVDPERDRPGRPCQCGSTDFAPERDVMDTWATSSLSPQIASGWMDDEALYGRVFPMSLRPQAHEIIRTWAFYTIVKSHLHFGVLPWHDVAISGWGLAPEGAGKISKSRGGGPMAPMEMIETYSADAVRYWAASTGFGRDAVIDESKIQVGARLVTKLWNVARFSERFLVDYGPPAKLPMLTPADRWALSRLQQLIADTTANYEGYEYASALGEAEAFFWRVLADNYIEMAKQRLYDEGDPLREGARYTLYHAFRAVLKLLAPVLPFVTEEIYRSLFGGQEKPVSIHRSRWPLPDPALRDERADAVGEALVEVATAVRRYKSQHNLSLNTELERLQVAPEEPALAAALVAAASDLLSVTRAGQIEVCDRLDPGLEVVVAQGAFRAALALGSGVAG
jgi:valyl-tRNA synthetase